MREDYTQRVSLPKLHITSFHSNKERIVFKAVYEGPEFTFHHGNYHDDAHMNNVEVKKK